MTLFLDPKKFSQLDEVEVLDGSESIPIIKDGDNKRVKVENLPIPDDIVESIVAGDNITVDDTDPANPIVSAENGGIITEYILNSSATPNDYTYDNWADLYAAIRSNPGIPVRVTLVQDETINLGSNAILDNITFNGNGKAAISGQGLRLAISGGTISSWNNGAITGGLGFGNINSSYIFTVPTGLTVLDVESSSLLASLGSQSFFNVGSGSIVYIRNGNTSYVVGSDIGGTEVANVTGTGQVIIELAGSNSVIGNGIVKGNGTFSIRVSNPAVPSDNMNTSNPNHTGAFTTTYSPLAEFIKYDNSNSGLSATVVQNAIDEIVANQTSDLPNNVLLPLESRAKYAVAGSSDEQVYDDTGFELPNQGDFPDGGFDIYEEVVPLWGEFVAVDQYGYGENFTITDATSSGGDLIESAVIWSNGRPSPFIEFTAQGEPGEDPRIHITPEEYAGVAGMLMRTRYTHNPTTGTTTVWRPAGDFETPEDTEFGIGWIKIHEQTKGEPWPIKTGVTETWKIGISRGRRLISRIIVNDFSGTNLADFNADNATDEYTVPDGVSGDDWVSRGLGRIIDSTLFTDRWLSNYLRNASFIGTWSAGTNNINFYNGDPTIQLSSYSASRGDMLRVRTGGTADIGNGSQVFVVDDIIWWDGSIWQQLRNLTASNRTKLSYITVTQPVDLDTMESDIAGKQNALGFTPEDVANKDTDGTLAANSDTRYPSQKATKTYADTKQPLDSDLTAIAALTPSNDDVVQRKAGAWTNRTPAQLKTDLALTKSDVSLGNVTNDAQLKAADLDTDGTLAANSDTKIASQKAVKTYARKQIGTGTGKLDGNTVRDYRVLGDAYLNGVATNTPSTNRWTFEFYEVKEACTLDRVAIEVTTAGAAGKLVRMALYTADSYWQPQTLVQDFGTVATDVGAVPTMKAVTLSPALTIQPGRYVGIIIQDGSAAFRILTGWALASNALNASPSTTPYRNITSLNGAGTVASGFAAVNPKWERDVYSGSASMNFFLRFREVA